MATPHIPGKGLEELAERLEHYDKSIESRLYRRIPLGKDHFILPMCELLLEPRLCLAQLLFD